MTYYARKNKRTIASGFWLQAALGVFLCLLLASRTFAQVNSATINGVVSDSSGAAIPGATVTATNLGNGIESSHTTDETGHYTIVNLVPGSYDVKATAQGLASVIRQKQELLIGVTVTFNFSLAVASVTQTVQVDTAPPEVDTTQSILNTVIETKDMDDLPTLSRGYTSLAALSPGVYVGAGTSTASASITIGTANSWSVGYVLDGASNARVMGNGNTANVAQDWIQEFSVVTDQAPAEYAFASSGYVNAVTRSGGNALHGRVYGYFQDASLNADPGFLAAGAAKPPYDQQRLGGTLGGPIKKDKLFYFLGFEHLHNLATTSIAIPAAFAASNLNPAVNLSSGSPPQTNDDILAMAKLDYQINAVNSLHMTLNAEHQVTTNNGIGTLLPVADGNSVNTQPENLTLTWDRTISPSMLNEARATTMGYFINTGCNYANEIGPYNQASASIPSQASRAGDPTGWYAVQTYTAANVTFGCTALWNTAGERQYTGSDHVSITHGAHTIKFGLEGGNRGRYLKGEHAQTDGTYTFQYGTTIFNPATPGTLTTFTGSGCTDCYPTQYKVNVDPNGEINGYDWDPFAGVFIQDTWKATPHLTLNMGMRWDEDFAYDFFGKVPAPAGQEPVLLPTNDPHDFGPRAGFAWTPFHNNSNLVVRGGFGVFYDANHSNFITNVLQADTAPVLGSGGLPLDIQITANSVSANPYCILGIATCTTSVPTAYQQYVQEVLASALQNITVPNFNPPGGKVVVGPNTYTIPTFGQQIPPSLANADPGFRDSGEYQGTIGVADQIGKFAFGVDYVLADGFAEYGKRNGNISQLGTAINPTYGVLQTLAYAGRLRSYGLQATGKYRDHRGDNIQLAYTLQYAYDNFPGGGGFTAGLYSAAADYYTDPFNNDVDYGPSGQAPKQILNVSGNVPLHFGVFLAPILSYNAGIPGDPTTSARPSATTSTPLLAPCPVYYALCWPALGPGGTYLKNQFHTPSNYSLATRLYKKFNIGEKRSASLFFEAFNLTNHNNLTGFSLNYTSNGSTVSSTFGNPTADGPSRKLQIGGQFDF